MTFQHRFDPTTLREYDIRGIVGRTLTEFDAFALGRCFGTIVARNGGISVAVGYDGRLSSPDLETALVKGLSASGIEATRIGRGPTPMLYYAATTLKTDGAVMVTGSHNPPDYNGFKMMLRGSRSSATTSSASDRLRSPATWTRNRSRPSATSTCPATILRDYLPTGMAATAC
jgi:phosphomannomutase